MFFFFALGKRKNLLSADVHPSKLCLRVNSERVEESKTAIKAILGRIVHPKLDRAKEELLSLMNLLSTDIYFLSKIELRVNTVRNSARESVNRRAKATKATFVSGFLRA